MHNRIAGHLTILLYEHKIKPDGSIESQLLIESHPIRAALAKALRYYRSDGSLSVHTSTAQLLHVAGRLPEDAR